ncbi:MAG TPA: hypothetical protein VIS74_07100 [Chthoniobacterales bacterium]
MGTPFKTAEEFIGATGAFHHLANSPVVAGISIGFVALIVVAVIWKSYTIKHD